MKKCLIVGAALVTSLSISAAFAQGLGQSIESKASHGRHQDTCLLDAFNSTLVAMSNEGQKNNVIAFKGGSGVKQALQAIQKKTCANTKGIKISTHNGLVVVQNTSANNPYQFYAWHKEDDIVIARLTPAYQII